MCESVKMLIGRGKMSCEKMSRAPTRQAFPPRNISGAILNIKIAGYTLLLSSPLFDCVQAHIAQMTIINIFEKKCNFDKKVAEKFGKGKMFDVSLQRRSGKRAR